MFPKTLLSFAMLAVTAAAIPSANKRATCSGGQTTANEAVSAIFSVKHAFDAHATYSAVYGSMFLTTSKPTCKPRIDVNIQVSLIGGYSQLPRRHLWRGSPRGFAGTYPSMQTYKYNLISSGSLAHLPRCHCHFPCLDRPRTVRVRFITVHAF